jgi:hypothetical protein
MANDVLDRHHKKNGRPRLPDPASLELLRHTVETMDPKQRNGEGPVSGQQSTTVKRQSHGAKATQLAFYPARWKSFLEDAKGECRAQHAVENPFPNLVEDLTSSITETLSTLLFSWNQAGKQLELGKLAHVLERIYLIAH